MDITKVDVGRDYDKGMSEFNSKDNELVTIEQIS